MGFLSRATSVPDHWADRPGDRIAALAALTPSDGASREHGWRLWLEAEWAKHAGNFALAERALDAADSIADATEWTPMWALETRGLRAKLRQDAGEPAQAYETVKWAMQGWLFARRALARPEGDSADFARSLLRGAHEMVTSLVPSEDIDALARTIDATPFEVTTAMWLTERLPGETRELVARAVALEGQVDSYAAARRLVNDVLAAMRSWMVEPEEALRFETGLRLGLAGAASNDQQFEAAVGQADDGLSLAGRLPDGQDRTRTEAELRANRANALLALGRAVDALAEYERAYAAFDTLDAGNEALRMRFGVLHARAGAEMEVRSTEVGALVAEFEAAVERGRADGGLQGDLEMVRRWWLSALAEEGTTDVERVVGIIEVLRDDQPVQRAGTTSADPVLQRLCRPFTILGARLSALDDTAVVVFEPGLGGGSRPRPPVLLTLASQRGGLRWALAPAADAAERLQELSRLATKERERLLTGEVALHAPPSQALVDAAAAAWNALPAAVADTLRAARTVLYMPSGLNALDAIPFELLRHEGGWLGATHVVARCPSFQLLERVLAPNAQRPSADARAVVACAREDARLGLLGEAATEADLAARAASLLGLKAERREMTDRAAVLDALTGRSLVHYIGHGFANAIGEFLPISADSGVSASELAEHDGSPGPFVFFNACLLGRVRHLSGGRQRGWALRLLDRGSPAVVGALAPVPDTACVQVARAFYGALRRAPVGEAVRSARTTLHGAGVHPVVWAAYVLHGDPNATLTAAHRTTTADLVCGWPALATRFLATGLPEDQGLLAAAADAPPEVAAWATGGEAADAGLVGATDRLLDRDPQGAAVCRFLLALTRLECDPGAGDELDVAWLIADALQDGYAALHVIDLHAESLVRRHPDLHPVLPSTARWWLAMLGGGRGRLADLADRLPGGV